MTSALSSWPQWTQTNLEVIAARVHSLIGDCHCARHLAHGGRPRSQAPHHDYLFRWSSRKCQVRLRDRRPRHRRRPPSRTRSHSIKSPLPTGRTLRTKSFYECMWSSCPLFNPRDGNQPQLEYRSALTVPHQGAGNGAPLCRIFAASLGRYCPFAHSTLGEVSRKNMAPSHSRKDRPPIAVCQDG